MTEGTRGASAGTHTLQPLVAVVLVDEDIVWGRGSANDDQEGHGRRTLLGLARLLICLGRKGKGVHLRVLREDAAHGGIVGHVEWVQRGRSAVSGGLLSICRRRGRKTWGRIHCIFNHGTRATGYIPAGGGCGLIIGCRARSVGHGSGGCARSDGPPVRSSRLGMSVDVRVRVRAGQWREEIEHREQCGLRGGYGPSTVGGSAAKLEPGTQEPTTRRPRSGSSPAP